MGNQKTYREKILSYKKSMQEKNYDDALQKQDNLLKSINNTKKANNYMNIKSLVLYDMACTHLSIAQEIELANYRDVKRISFIGYTPEQAKEFVNIQYGNSINLRGNRLVGGSPRSALQTTLNII